MPARIKNFNTDFTRFLGGKTRHTVKIVTKTETLECSGAVLSQNSEVMRKLVEKDDEIYLDGFEFAKECLSILHGGSVQITMDNCEEIIKFGIQFHLIDIIEQGLEYLASSINENNLKSSAEICLNADRFATSCDLEDNIDYFWPLESTIDELWATEIEAFVVDITSTVSTKAVVQMLKNRTLASKLLDSFTALIDEANIEEILKTFLLNENHNMYVEAFSGCSTIDISSFFETIEAFEQKKNQRRVYNNLKKCILRESEANRITLKFDSRDLLTKWKSFSEEKLKQFCKVFETDFYIVEVIMSWVALNKPDLKTVRQICSLIDTSKLHQDYLEHATRVFKAEGYMVAFDLENCITEENFNIFRNKIVYGDMYTTEDSYSDQVVSRTVYGGDSNNFSFTGNNFYDKYGGKKVFFTVTISIRSNEKIKWDCYTGGHRKIYGRTQDGKQIPFYTDVESAIRSDTQYDLTTFGSLK